ncbi:MAG: hypothetical protein WA755_17945 [Candidatus Acidiferrales bacterium]
MTLKIPWLGRFILLASAFGCAAALAVARLPAAPSPSYEPPKVTIDEDCGSYAISSDNHIVFSVRHVFNWKKYTVEGDDLWVSTIEGKRKRLIEGSKLVKTPDFHSYSINDLAWSPDSTKFTILKSTEQLSDKQGNIGAGQIIELMDIEGREIKVEGAKENPLVAAYQATWLADGVTVAFLKELIKPRQLAEIHIVQPAGGKTARLFGDHQYLGVAWDAAHNAAIAVERGKGYNDSAELVSLDLLKETRTELAKLDKFQGQLTLSPSGKNVAYFADGDNIEVRDLASPAKAIRVSASFGRFEWAPDERHILLKRGPDTRTGTIQWVDIFTGEFSPALHDLSFHDFHISPDGRWITVEQPGKRVIMIYALSGLL